MSSEPQRQGAAHPPQPHPPPPDPPELPAGVERGPRWPWWHGVIGFLVAVAATAIVGAVVIGVLAAATGLEDVDDASDPLIVTVGAGIQYAAFIGAALGFAYLTLRPRAWHFGLRRTRFWPALAWTATGFGAFFLFSIVYAALIGAEEQSTLEDLGAEDSQAGLVIAAVLVIVVAPVAEEFFFRGFFYRTLRNSLPVWAAALIGGVVFGIVHAFTGIEAVPVLAVFGVILCLLYEQTGSLYPPIALHAFNNMIAYMVGTEAIGLSAAIGLATVAGCVLVPRFAGRSAPAAA